MFVKRVEKKNGRRRGDVAHSAVLLLLERGGWPASFLHRKWLNYVLSLSGQKARDDDRAKKIPTADWLSKKKSKYSSYSVSMFEGQNGN